MEEDERKTKQSYLRQSILEKNYDPEEFIGYLNDKLNIESDLNKCSMEELKSVVEQFVDDKESVIVEKPKEIEQSLIIKREMKASTVVYKDYNPPVVEEEFDKQFKCLKIIPKYSAQILSKMKCEVSKPERKYMGGIFGIGATSFLEFQVTTSEVGWCVGRRYSDFVWFRTILKKYFPSSIIPPIPNKKAAKRLPRQIEKRMRILTYFLNDLLKMPQVVNSKYLEMFLSIKDPEKFESFKSQAESKVTFENIASTETESGSVLVALSNENTTYYRQLKKFANKSQIIYKEVTRASKRFQAQRIDQVNQLYQLGNKFAQLYEIGKEFYTLTKSDSIQNLSEIYIKLNNMMIEWGNNIKNQIELLEVNFNTFFKYARESYMGFNEYFEKLDKMENNFLKRKSEIDDKKERIFLLHDPSKWEIPKKDIPFLPKSSIHQRSQAFRIMLPKQSVQVQALKQNYSFYLSRLHQNSSKYFQRQMVKFNQNFNEFAIKTKVNNQQLGQNWNQMCYLFSVGNKAAKKLLMMQKLQQIKVMGDNQGAED